MVNPLVSRRWSELAHVVIPTQGDYTQSRLRFCPEQVCPKICEKKSDGLVKVFVTRSRPGVNVKSDIAESILGKSDLATI